MEIRVAMDDFLRHCAVERRLSANTLQAYACDLTDLRAWLSASGLSAEISTDTLKKYLEAMVIGRHLATSTVRRRMACLRAFFRRAYDLGQMNDPFVGWRLMLPQRKRLPRALSRTEMSSLLSFTRSRAVLEDSSDAQLQTAVRLMVSTGVRVGELCKLMIEDISPDGGSLRVQGKGSRDRVAYIADIEFRAELQALVRRRRIAGGPSTPLFVNRKGRKLMPQSIRLKLRYTALDAGLVRRITPHMLRHTAATLLIETGVDIRIVQRLLGHASIATTEIYTHVSDEALKSTLERADILRTLSRQ